MTIMSEYRSRHEALSTPALALESRDMGKETAADGILEPESEAQPGPDAAEIDVAV